MAAHVAQAFDLERHLLVQAGTGTGKSLGYLVPALHHAGASTKPIVVATATLALQAQIVKRDLPKLMEALSSEPESETPGRNPQGQEQLSMPAQTRRGIPRRGTRYPLRHTSA